MRPGEEVYPRLSPITNELILIVHNDSPNNMYQILNLQFNALSKLWIALSGSPKFNCALPRVVHAWKIKIRKKQKEIIKMQDWANYLVIGQNNLYWKLFWSQRWKYLRLQTSSIAPAMANILKIARSNYGSGIQLGILVL